MYTDWAIRDFTEGMIDVIEEGKIPENAAKDVQNWISRRIGSLMKRPGQVRLNPSLLDGPIHGMHAYYYDIVKRRLVVAAGTKVYTYSPLEETFSEIKTGISSSQPVVFETCVNYMVAFNGVDTPWKFEGNGATTLANAPVDGQFPVLHKEKLFVVPVTDPSTLRWSDSFQPESWPGVNYWDVKKGDGDSITNLKKFLGELVVFKRRSIHSLKGTNLDDFRIDEMDSKIGCVGPFAATVHGSYIYFVSDEGLCVYNGLKVINLSQQRIPRLWEKINKAHIDKAAVGVWDSLIWFALPEGESQANNLVIVYVPPEEGAVGGKFWPWRGIHASCFQSLYDGSKLSFYSGDTLNGYVNQQYVGTADFGGPIDAYWVGKYFDMGSPERIKKAKRAFVDDSPNTEDVIALELSLDYGPFASLPFRREANMVREFKFNHNNRRWRYLAPKLIHNGTNPCEVRGILIPYKAKRKPKVR